MKNKIVFLLILTTLFLVACGGTTTDSVDSVNGSTNTENANAGQADSDLLQANLFLFGTVQLDGTEHEVTAAQAAELLPLWQLLETMSGSNTTAQEEVEAVLKQIEAKMTTEQLAYITEQEFNAEDMFSLAQEMGIELTFAGPGGDGSDRPEGGFGGGFGGGGFGGGGQPGGIIGGTPDPELQATIEARRAERGGGVNTAFYQIVITLLEGKIAD